MTDFNKPDPNIVIMAYISGSQIVTVKDHYEKLEKKIEQLENMGIEVILIPGDKEAEVKSLFLKHGAKNQLAN